jgi:hypothetical protein
VKTLSIVLLVLFAVMLVGVAALAPVRAQGDIGVTVAPGGPTLAVTQTYPTAVPITPQAVCSPDGGCTQPPQIRVAAKRYAQPKVTPTGEVVPPPTSTTAGEVLPPPPTSAPTTEPPQEPKPTTSPAPVITEGQISILAAILIGIVSAIAGALASGLTGVRLIVKILESANHDPALLTAIEGLTKSVPVEIVQALNLSAQIVEKVTDGAPNLSAVDAQVKRTMAAFTKAAEAETLLPMPGDAAPDITAVG